MKTQHLLLLRFGNTAMHYYEGMQPTEDDYKDWLHGLPTNIRDHMTMKGFESCENSLPLRRHALERRDVGMIDFMRELLNDVDFAEWKFAEQSDLNR